MCYKMFTVGKMRALILVRFIKGVACSINSTDDKERNDEVTNQDSRLRIRDKRDK